MRRLFVAAMTAALVAVLSACGSGDLVEGRKYYSSDERKSMMTEPYDTFAMEVQSAMQRGKLGKTVSYVLPKEGHFPLECEVGTPAPAGYVGQIQVCTVDRMYMLSGVTDGSPRLTKGKVFALRASDVNARKDKNGIISGSYRNGTKLVTTDPVATRAEIQAGDTELINVFGSRTRIFK